MRIFPLLLFKGIESIYKKTPDDVNKMLFAAVDAGDTKAVNKIISIPGFDVNKPRDVYGKTFLANAAHNGSYKIAEALIKKGADINTKTGFYYTALHAAISGSVFEDLNGNLSMINLLLSHGADINSGTFTPLMGACVQGRKDVIELLLSKGADPKLRDNEGKTAVDFIEDGRAYGKVQLIKELKDLLTPVHAAVT